MDVQPGIYKITNFKSETALTLAAYDDRTVVGLEHNKNGSGKNQRWIIDFLGDGYSIRSARSQGYLSFGCPSGDATPVIAVPHPATWVLEHEPGEAEDVFRIHWPNGHYALDLEAGSPKPLTKVRIHHRLISNSQGIRG
ncbi:hypothetical protein M0805_008222 [Coniferiporia weirii]|nr:hypothetical protein M0805_008222 [Coniferiporia weirii]